MPLDTVIFDYGGVLTLQPREDHLSRTAELLELSPQEVKQRTGQFRRIYDRGAIDGAEYWRLMSGSSDPLPSEIVSELVAVDVDSWTQPNEQTLALARELKEQGVTLGLLSNMQPDCLAHIREHFDWLSLFDGAVYSCEVDLTKPEPKIYHLALDRLGASPDRAAFIDDTWENVEAAERVGIRGILFESASALRATLAGELSLPAREA